MRMRDKSLVAVGVVMLGFLLYVIAYYHENNWMLDGLFPYIFGAASVMDVMVGILGIRDHKDKED